MRKETSDYDVGNSHSFDVHVTSSLIDGFASISGDTNSIHISKNIAQEFGLKDRVAHGMLGGALFSRLIGMYLPGEGALYLSQELRFKNPIYVENKIRVTGTILQKVDALGVLKINTTITDIESDEILIEGIALVKLL